MPIRSTGGRLALARRLVLGPLLRTRTRALLVGVGAVAVIVAVSLVATGSGSDPAGAGNSKHGPMAAPSRTDMHAPDTSVIESSNTPSSSSSATSAATLTAAPPAALSKHAANKDRVRAAQTVAGQFARIWVANISPKQWHTELERLSTSEYGKVTLAQVPGPDAVPARKLTSHAITMRHATGSGHTVRDVDADVATDAGRVRLHLQDIPGDGRFRVSEVTRAHTGGK